MEIRQYQKSDRATLEKQMETFQEYLVRLDGERQIICAPGYGQAQVADMLQQTEKENGQVFVACEGDVIVGFSACVIWKQDATAKLGHVSTVTGHVTELYVEEQYRGRGVGKQLLRHIEEYLKEKGCNRMYIEVFGPNKQALQFYETNGYNVRDYMVAKTL